MENAQAEQEVCWSPYRDVAAGPPRIPGDPSLALSEKPTLKKARGHHPPCSGTGLLNSPQAVRLGLSSSGPAERALTPTLGSAGRCPGLEPPPGTQLD